MNRFRPADFFLLRTPLLDFGHLERWSAAAPEQRQEMLRELVSRPVVMNALAVGAPSVAVRVREWLEGEREADRRLIVTLARYLARMCAKPTPFGLFGAISLGDAGPMTELRLEDGLHSHTRVDSSLLTAIAARVESAGEPLLITNTTLYERGPYYRYLEEHGDADAPSWHLAAVRATPAVRRVVDAARGGVRRRVVIDLLRQSVAGAAEAQLDQFVDTLIADQVVVPASLPLTEADPLGLLAAGARQPEDAQRLHAIRDALAAADAAGPAVPGAYDCAAEAVNALAASSDAPPLHTVLVRRAHASLGPDVLRLAGTAVELLQELGDAAGDAEMDAFRQAFAQKYESREVPLLEALDPEAGIGFGPAPLPANLEELRFAPPAPAAQWDLRSNARLALLLRAYENRSIEIELTAADRERVRPTAPLPLPESFNLLFTLGESDGQRLELVLGGIGGPPGARLMGRFVHAEPALERAVSALIRTEESLDPDVVHAELLYVPGPKAGNIVGRPSFRRYEIPLFTTSAMPDGSQIGLDDLRLSLDGARLVLRSERLDREVVPRLTSAHNLDLRTNSPIYRFLGKLQYQGTGYARSWSWGALENAPFTPRVRVRDIVLRRACWRVPAGEAEALKRAPAAGRAELLRAWVDARRIPRWITCRALTISTADADAPQALASLVEEGKGLEITEVYPPPERSMARGPNGTRFVSEIDLPFLGQPVRRATHVPRTVPAATRTCLPGSEWLFVKLYTGAATVDTILAEAIGPLLASFRGASVDRWFFIRYNDPDPHLRVRFRGGPDALHSRVLPALEQLAAALHSERLLSRMVVDTYEPEIERYGGSAVFDFAERIFEAESDAFLRLVGSSPPGDLQGRLLSAICSAHLLLRALVPDEEERQALSRARGDQLKQESGLTTRAGRDRLAGWVRTNQEQLLEAMSAEELFAAVRDALAPRDAIARSAGEALREAAGRGALTRPLRSIVISLMHMNVNRWMISHHRLQELLVFDALDRLLRRIAARASGVGHGTS